MKKQIIQIICLAILLLGTCNSDIKIKIESPKGSKMYVEKNLIEYINEGKEEIITHIEKYAIMVLGLSGTGKTTLVNYLNDVPLICTKLNGKWIIDLKYKNETLPGGFKIGHGSHSETMYPASFTPAGAKYTFIDNPGFKDTRGIATEISNGFFREQITSNVTHFKFLLLLTHLGVDDARSEQVRETIKAFSSFLGVFGDDETKSLSKSIGIVITRVDNDGESDLTMKKYFKEKLLNILKGDEMFQNIKFENQKLVFENILMNDQMEIFSNPKKRVDLDSRQKNKIKKLINRLKYIKKSDVGIKVRIENSFIPELLVYTQAYYDKFIKSFEDKLGENILNFYKNKLKENMNVHNAAVIYTKIKDFCNYSDESHEFEYFLKSLDQEIFRDKEVDELIFKKNVISFFIDLLPIENRNTLSLVRKWMSHDMIIKLINLMNQLIDYFEQEKNKFEQHVETVFIKLISEYYRKSIDKAVYIEDVLDIREFLIEIQVKSKENLLDGLINNINDDLVSQHQKNKLSREKNSLDFFFQHLPPEKKEKFSSTIWLGKNLDLKIKMLMNELERYYNERKGIEFYFEKSNFIFKGYFGKMSSILQKINDDESISNLKSVRIYTTHSLIFDVNYKILKERYSTHSPDLIIISPIVKIVKNLTIDLSCDHMPGYPDNLNKADSGKPGTDGKPGLPGYNSGNCFILANHIFNRKSLKIIAQGGKGGPGQHGGDGIDGLKGENALLSEVKCEFWKKNDDYGDGNNYGCKPIEGTELVETIVHNDCTITAFDIKHPCIYSIFEKAGKCGSDGGDGGRGGIGGLGGFSGTSILIDKNDEVKIYTNYTRSGTSGVPGKPGLGGIRGDYAQRTFLIFIYPILIKSLTLNLAELLDNKGFEERFDKSVSTLERCTNNGNIYLYKNSVAQIMPERSQLSFYNHETEYLNFLTEVRKEFEETRLLERDFCKFLINNTSVMPNLKNLIERTKILNDFESRGLLPFLLEEIVDFYNRAENLNDKMVLLYIYATVQSTINRFNSQEETTLIINVKKLFEITRDEIKKWESLERQNVKFLYKSNYESNLKIKIDEAQSFIETLQEDIENEEREVNKNIREILEKISKLKNESLENDRNYTNSKQEAEEELRKTLFLKLTMGVFKIGCNALMLVGFQGQIAGSILQTGLDIGTNIASSHMAKPITIKTTSFDTTLDKALGDYKTYLKDLNSKELAKIESEVKTLETHEKIENKMESVEKVSNNKPLEVRIEELPESRSKYKVQIKYGESMLNENNPKEAEKYKNMVEKAKAKYESDNLKAEKAFDHLGKFSKSLKVAKIISEVNKDYNDEYKIGKEEIEKIKEEVEKNANIYRNLDKVEKEIEEFQNKLLKQIQNELKSFTRDLQGRSLISFNFKEWQMSKRLDELKSEMMSIMDKVESTKLKNSMNRMEQAIKTIIDIHRGIANYKQQIEFSNLIADLTQTELQIGVPIEYQNELNSLKKTILANIIKESYEKALKAFKYWSFPFYCDQIYNVRFHHVIEDSNDSNIERLIKSYSDHLDKLFQIINNDDVEIKASIDNYLQNFEFDSDYAFYQWSSHDFPFEIEQLLAGEKVVLYADVKTTIFDALKFCTLNIRIDIKSNNSANQELNELLKHVFVELTHSGISNYKFKDDIYVINLHHNSDKKVSFRYQYGSTSLNNANESYKKLASNKPILSPYTFWEIKLDPIINDHKFQIFNAISSITREQKEISVSLFGIGQYVKNSCNQNFNTTICKEKRDSNQNFLGKCSVQNIYSSVLRHN